MDYPIYRNADNVVLFSMDSTRKRIDPLLVSTARSGAFKARRLQEAATYTYNVIHRGLTTAQLEAHRAFVDANRMSPVVLFWIPTGESFSCLMGGEWTEKNLAGDLWEIEHVLYGL